MPNRLYNSASPYLRQHANNPVDWYPWGPEALGRAAKEDKPILVSIGYSACHWCHVMERESFENPDIAALMNSGFICIKVDREERPDIDQVYMEAAHAMGLQGGWPLNVFVTPEQKPFYGGTYFRPAQWRQVLQGIERAFRENRKQLEESAGEFARSIALDETQRYGLKPGELSADRESLPVMAEKLRAKFDRQYGGLDRAPKFPNPSIWMFLLHANLLLSDEDIGSHVQFSLHRMALGGIYDQIGGGFARYSVDNQWFAPHFEKMLYDNAQLISLYARAFQVYGTADFSRVVHETIAFAERELMNAEGGFYSALDADSENKEGKYYVWEKGEFDRVLGSESALMSAYFGLSPGGNWEEGANILCRPFKDDEFASMHSISAAELRDRVDAARLMLLKHREGRVRPGLDDKILAGWNGLMLTALCDAFAVFGEIHFLELARRNAAFIESQLIHDRTQIWRALPGKGGGIPAYLEDYAAVIQGLIGLYQVDLNEHWLYLARDLADRVIADFHDGQNGLFYYTSNQSETLIARSKELFDNVIPSSNSIMAVNLYRLGLLFEEEYYIGLADRHLAAVKPLMFRQPQFLCNWGTLYSMRCYPTAEVALSGPDVQQGVLELEKRFLPNKVIAGSLVTSRLPLLQNREPLQGKLSFYVCFDKTCKLPVQTAVEALNQIEEAFAKA